MSNLLTYIQSQTKPRYTDLQQTSLSQYIKTQTAKTPQQTSTQSSTPPKYGTVNGKTTLPSHIENQGLYNLSNEKNGITAVTEGFGLGVSNTLKNIANTIDTVKAYTAVPAGVYKDIQPAFYDVNKASLVAGIADSNQQKYGKNSTYRSNIESDIVKRNNTQNQWTQQVYDNHKDVKYGDKIIGIGQGVASTLPYMAVSGLTASPEIGRLALGWNTLGDAVGEALSDGATFDQATGYALSQAGKEMAISKLAGGIPYLDDGLFSTGGITEKYISNPLLQALINRGVDIVGEGAEEAASTYLTPYLKRAFYDKTAPNATADELWNSFKSGANISAILGIASGAGKLATQTESFIESDKVYKTYSDAIGKEIQHNQQQSKANIPEKAKVELGTDVEFDNGITYNKNINNDFYTDDMYSFSLRFMSNRDNLYRNLNMVEEIEGYEDISCHADPYSFGFVDPDTGETVQEFTAKQFAKIVKDSGKYKGGKIRLISCQSGALDAGLAQEFADEIGATVLAPTKIVFTNSQGYIVLADSKEEAGKLLRKAKEKWTPDGWREFKPRG